MFFKANNKIKVYISISPKSKGGGANTFAYNFVKWLKANKDTYHYEKNILKANKAIVIANKVNFNRLKQAKKNGCYIIHRLDEHFEENEDEYRKLKHQQIIDINQLADITIYQSQFVFENIHPYLNPEKYQVIINGADQKIFYPAKKNRDFIGHVSWGIGDKKRYDLLYNLIKNHSELKFLLIGNHLKTRYNFKQFKNIKIVKAVSRKKLVKYFQQMKILYFPSENDPCPNTAVEAIMSGIPVCYNENGGTIEIVKNCGEPLQKFDELLQQYISYKQKCLKRTDLDFDTVAQKYMNL